MKGIDTNVLVRYIVQDDPEQSKQAVHFIETTDLEGDIIFVNGIVLCELVWVLETAYEYPRSSIADILEKILRTRQFHIHQTEILWNSLNDYRGEHVDFADGYIAHLNSSHECEYTVTFDKRAARLKYFKQLGNKKS